MASSSRSGSRKSSRTSSPKISKKEKAQNKDSLQYQPLDIQRTLAERLERERKEKELHNFNDDISTHFSLSDSCFDLSQETDVAPRSSLKNLPSLDIFDENSAFHMFNKSKVNFSWLKDDCSAMDVPKMDPDKFVLYLNSEIKGLCCKRSTSLLACRYLFYLMSVDSDVNVMEVCYTILCKQIENDLMQFSIPVSDLLPVIMNYGTVKSKLWPSDHKITFPSAFREKKEKLNILSGDATSQHMFPTENFRYILKLLLFNLKAYPYFTDSEKESIFYMMLNVAMAKGISHDWSFIVIIKDILVNITMTYTDEEWSAHAYRKVEDLVSKAWHDDLDPIGIIQRIGLIPASSARGIQLQKAASYFAIQHLMDCDPIYLCGVVTVSMIKCQVCVYFIAFFNIITDQ